MQRTCLCAFQLEIDSGGLLRGQPARDSSSLRDQRWNCLASLHKREQGVRVHSLSVGDFPDDSVATNAYLSNLDIENRLLV
ncbi:hypothetical protein NDU88_001458 [Pleurodeles waltl]|uniref:Uncharacterized protein n=1 Tax=Pleurodeles waltl TaxID=8319 RepID=A0AAV7NJ34_PLEWA|nr:hypothetical protein NDU88_001458 [Pleurodeles waltl]